MTFAVSSYRQLQVTLIIARNLHSLMGHHAPVSKIVDRGTLLQLCRTPMKQKGLQNGALGDSKQAAGWAKQDLVSVAIFSRFPYTESSWLYHCLCRFMNAVLKLLGLVLLTRSFACSSGAV